MTIAPPTLDETEADRKRAVSKALRKDFPAKLVGYKPTIWCEHCSNSRNGCDRHAVARCAKCAQMLTVAHKCLGFVNHGRVTARLLDCDPAWYWRPMPKEEWPSDPGPHGMWIYLEVAGFPPMPGLGEQLPVKGMSTGNRIKATISDAIKNAAMRRGIALSLWSGDEFGSEEDVLTAAAVADLDDPEATGAALDWRTSAEELVENAKNATTLAQVNELIGTAQKSGLWGAVLSDGSTPSQHLKAAARRTTGTDKRDARANGKPPARPVKQTRAGKPTCACPPEQLLADQGHDAGCPQAA